MRTPNISRGYSLVELIVAVGIFSMTTLIVTSVYLALVNLDRQARATNQLAANLDFAMESMVRNIRTGRDYECPPPNCNLTFTDSEDVLTHYRENSDGTIGICTGDDALNCTDENALPLTDPQITVEDLRFYVPDDEYQPRVVIVAEGTMETNLGEEIRFSIQSSAA
ncbi:MAG TPA: type II secretion system protein, partial [Candidatus Paceibacterota bacterium]|nr:type II secretion system protein [Candidatus Paceibacterota bacterium]